MAKLLECTKKNKNGVQNVVGKLEIKNSTEDNDNAELFIYGDIVKDDWYKWADSDVCPQDITDFLRELDNFKDIDIYINSGGGSVFAGIAIYNQLKRHKGCKNVYVDGIAASIASVIACAGDNIIIPTCSQFMIHKPSICAWDSFDADYLRQLADRLDVCQESITNIYMENVKDGVTREEITNLINAETWFTGETVTEYFNFKVEESAEAVASASTFYNKYKNVPEGLRNKSFFNAKNQAKLPEMDKEVADMIARINEKAKEWAQK